MCRGEWNEAEGRESRYEAEMRKMKTHGGNGGNGGNVRSIRDAIQPSKDSPAAMICHSDKHLTLWELFYVAEMMQRMFCRRVKIQM